jgi:hypothetical protein
MTDEPVIEMQETTVDAQLDRVNSAIGMQPPIVEARLDAVNSKYRAETIEGCEAE